MGFYSDLKKIILRWIVDFVEEKGKIEFNELRDNTVFEFGSARNSATEYIQTLISIKKILYVKEGDKVFIYAIHKKEI